MSDRIGVVPYDPECPGLFARLSGQLREALGSVATRIDHIGSTSVPGLAAKPIVDVQISVDAFEPIDRYRLPLKRLGYGFRSDNSELTKRYFREAPGTRRTHIHVRRAGSWAEQFALLFRDYLRSDEGESKRYEGLKLRLAGEFERDRHAYTEAKGPFIWEIMAQADRWSQEVGWEPGPPDA